jgi:hypothetical protein
MMVGLSIFWSSAVTTYRGYATMSTPVMWLFALIFGVPAVFDLTVDLAGMSRQDIVHNLARLCVGVFMLYCALRVQQGKRETLASRGTVIAGHLCFAFLAVMLLFKLGQYLGLAVL